MATFFNAFSYLYIVYRLVKPPFADYIKNMTLIEGVDRMSLAGLSYDFSNRRTRRRRNQHFKAISCGEMLSVRIFFW